MRWSKVRKLVHESFADSVRGRVKLNVTNADREPKPFRCGCIKGWISVDGQLIAHIEPHPQPKLTLSLPEEGDSTSESRRTVVITQPWFDYEGPVTGDECTFMNLPQACWQYLHSSINDSLHSTDPFVSALAMLNAKVGRIRLKRAQGWDLHPLTRAMLEFRLHAEATAARATAA